jgi:hypothetical protein
MPAPSSPPEPSNCSKTTGNNSETIFSISVMLIIVPAYLYMCSYQYEKGICNYYGIPTDLISLDIISNLTVCISLFTIIYLVIIGPYVVMTYLLIFMADKAALHVFAKYNFLAVCYGYAYWLSLTAEIDWVKTLIAAGIVTVFVNFAAYKQYRLIKKNPQLMADIENDKGIMQSMAMVINRLPDPFHLKKTILKQFQASHAVLIFLLIVVAEICYNIGQREAFKKTDYEISTDKPGWVLLRKYGDDMIMKKLDTKTTLGQGLSIIKISQFNSLNFVTKPIGKLHSSANQDY